MVAGTPQDNPFPLAQVHHLYQHLPECCRLRVFYALSLPGAMISIVSMVRRGSVIVSFLFGAALFHEKNLKAKFVDLLLVLIGMLFLYFGSK